MPKIPEPKTLVIDNFQGMLTHINNGDLNSGFAKYATTFGNITFDKPKQLEFYEKPIDITGAVITDCIVAMKAQVESFTIYVYAIGHTGRLYKIQVNNVGTHTPVVDTAVLLATLSINSPTFNYGASLDFNTTTQLYIGHDMGVTSINTDGSTEAAIGDSTAGHWTQNVPRQSAQANGNFYYTNGSNVAIVQSGSVTTYTAFSPGFATNYVTKDLDVTSDFNYLVVLASTANKFSITSTAPDTNSAAQVQSIIGYWNFTAGSSITTAQSVPSFNQSAYKTFGKNEYYFGFDLPGLSVSTPDQGKILSMTFCNEVIPNAIGTDGNLVGFTMPEWNGGFLKASTFVFGNLDSENPVALTRTFQISSSLTAGDILFVPATLLISNMTWAGHNQGYVSPLAAYGRMYFSTIEYNGSTTAYKFYTFYNVPVGTGTAQAGVYETQTELFSKKMQCKEYRVYMNPIASTSFKIDLIGIDGSVISGTSKTFSPSSTDNMVQCNPQAAPSPAYGVRITNVGSVTPVISKIEIDVVTAGK